jgi:hypothetical protein
VSRVVNQGNPPEKRKKEKGERKKGKKEKGKKRKWRLLLPGASEPRLTAAKTARACRLG